MNDHPVIFTDLDGTLLDHYTYSYDPVVELLSVLDAKDVPVVANTSKTKEELVAIRAEIGNKDPFIVENGSAVYVPKDRFVQCPSGAESAGDLWCKSFSRRRHHWLDIIDNLPGSLRSQFIGFSTMSIEEIQASTGLSYEKASHSAKREFGEPLHWTGREEMKAELISRISAAGGQVLAGGRFLHVGDSTDKGAAMQWLKQFYQERLPEKQIIAVALGDSPNDVAMLERADYAVVIASPVHSPPQLKRTSGVVYSKKYGPAGWDEEIRKYLRLER